MASTVVPQNNDGGLNRFTWISVAQYQRWLQLNVPLKEINLDHVYTVKIRGTTAANVLSRKAKLMDDIAENRARLETYIDTHRLAETELQFVSVLQNNYAFLLETLEAQIEYLDKLAEYDQAELLYIPLGQEYDDIPF